MTFTVVSWWSLPSAGPPWSFHVAFMEHNTVRVTRHSTETSREISVEDAQQTILQFSMSQIVCVPY